MPIRDVYMANVGPSGSVFVETLDCHKAKFGLQHDWGRAWVPVVGTSIENARHVACALPGARPYEDQAHEDAGIYIRSTEYNTVTKIVGIDGIGLGLSVPIVSVSVHKPIVQDWVCALGLRYQGVLVAAVRGCDTAPRHDKSKVLQRIYRCEILNAHVGDPAKSKSFILQADTPTTQKVMQEFLDDCDHYPHHFCMHLIHAAEILGYRLPNPLRRDLWNSFYAAACKKLHVKCEQEHELRARLEAKESQFEEAQKPVVRAELYEQAHSGGT